MLHPSENVSGTILNVDDDVIGRCVTTRILQNAGFKVLEADNGAAALKMASEKPDLILLDVNLPDTDGFEVCRRLKADQATVATPVLLLSATYVEPTDRVHGLEGGADGYMTEPFDPPVLVAQIRALLRVRQAEAREQQARRTAEEAVRRVSGLQKLTAALSRAVTTEEMYDVIIGSGLAALGASAGLISILPPNQREFINVRFAGFPPEVLENWRRFPVHAANLIAEAVRRRGLVIVREPGEAVDRFADVPFFQQASGVGVLVATPLQDGRACALGGLGLVFPPGHPMEEQDRSFLHTVASVCTESLEQASLHDAEQAARIRAEREIEERKRAEAACRKPTGARMSF